MNMHGPEYQRYLIGLVFCLLMGNNMAGNDAQCLHTFALLPFVI